MSRLYYALACLSTLYLMRLRKIQGVSVIMSKLYNNIEDLCRAKKITITEMCRQAGVSRASLTDLKMGRKQSLAADTLSKIAGLFSVTVDYLLGNTTDTNVNFDSFTYAMHNASKDLTDSDKEILLSMAQKLRKANITSSRE